MAIAPAATRTPKVALFGTISGGVLHGWSYALLRYVATDKAVYMDLRCTRPDWPFPNFKEVRFGRGDFHRLVPGVGAKRLEVLPLIAEAKELAMTGKK